MFVRSRSAAVAAALLLLAVGPAAAQTAGPAKPAVEAPAAEPEKPARRSRAKSTAKAKSTVKREPSVRQLIAAERRRKCSVEWKEAKAAGKVAEGTKWPKFYSRCNARLKGDAA